MTDDTTSPPDTPPGSEPPEVPHHQRKWSRMAVASAVIAGIIAAIVILAGPAHRIGIVDYRTAISGLRFGAYAAMGGVVIAILGMVFARPAWGARGMVLAAGALVINLAVAITLIMMASRAYSVPPIHDITTNMMDPPQFEAVADLRASGENSTDYAGIDKIGRLQAKAYPDLEPIYVMETPDAVFDRAEQAARALGWDIVALDPENGRIEATDTTFWFGFKDDVVIRVREAPMNATSLDVRSASRVGVSDIGTNAARIRAFLNEFGVDHMDPRNLGE